MKEVVLKVLDNLRGGRPFGYIIPILLLFFMAAWWRTVDDKILDLLSRAFWAVLTGGGVAVGYHLGEKKR